MEVVQMARVVLPSLSAATMWSQGATVYRIPAVNREELERGAPVGKLGQSRNGGVDAKLQLRKPAATRPHKIECVVGKDCAGLDGAG